MSALRKEADVVVVGGGMAGLACAVELHRAGREPLVLDAGDGLGGRVRTDVQDGFRLDRGFQVFLTAYPEAQRLLNYDRLDLRSFRPGALVRRHGAFHLLADPVREPQHAIDSLQAPIGSIGDKLRVGLLRLDVAQRSLAEITHAPETTTLEALRKRGFSADMVEGFFRPFFSGIFLERELTTSSRMFEFVFRMFTLGKAALPNRGMGQIPLELATRLPPDSIQLGPEAVEVGEHHVLTGAGERVQANAVVVATGQDEAALLTGAATRQPWHSAACLYFAAEKPPVGEPLLMLNGDSVGLANTVVALDQVAPGYAPAGASLISVSTAGDPGLDEEALWETIQAEMQAWFGPQASRWHRLRAYRIPRALPNQSVGMGLMEPAPPAAPDGPWLCGDYRVSSSLNGTIQSGRQCAERILASSA